jgi:hypothetical protein
MKKIVKFLLILWVSHFQSYAQLNHAGRGMYVSNFFKTAVTSGGIEIIDPNYSVLNITTKEDSLLLYAKNNHITYLILYDLHRVFGNTTYENYLCAFIQKAKTLYAIEKIGMASSCAAMFDNVAVVAATPSFFFPVPDNSSYQQKFNFVSQVYKPGDSLFYISEATKLALNTAVFNNNCAYKIDVLVTEYEFWNTGTDNCLDDSVTEDQKYQRFQQMVIYMDSIRDKYNSTHSNHQLFVETYLGFLNQNTLYSHQAIADWIDGSYNGKRRVDRINLHYYAGDASKMYSRASAGWNTTGYYQTRFFDFCQSSNNSQTNVLPIMSSEYIPWGAGSSFLGSWFYLNVNNNIFTAEKYYYDDWYDDAHNFNPTTVGNSYFGNVIQPGQALWFASYFMKGHLDNPVVFTSNSPVCVSNGQNGAFQFQYQGPIEQGLSFNFYITDEGSTNLRCGSLASINWPAYNPVTHASIDLNAALNSCSLPIGNYEAHLILNYSPGYSYVVPPAPISVVNSGKIVALTPVTVCQGNPVYLQASSTGGGTTSYAWYKGNTAISGATGSTYAPNPASTGAQNYSCLITSSISSCSANKTNSIVVTINTYPSASISLQSSSNCSSVLKANPASSTYLWHDGSTASTYTANVSGNYSAAVTSNGCTSIASYLNRNVNIEKIDQSNTCQSAANGSIKVNLYWGTGPYTLSWTGPVSGSCTGLLAGNKLIDNLPSGIYTITVSDANGCSKILSPQPIIASFPAINISSTFTGASCINNNGGSASVTSVTGGAGGPYSYFWNFNNSTASSINGIPFGAYTVTVTDAAGCSGNAVINVPLLSPPEICGNGMDDNCNGLIDDGCVPALNLKMFIQGFYRGNNLMAATVNPVLYPTLCDTITVELHKLISPYTMEYKCTGTINVSGNGSFNFPNAVLNQNYYVVIRHRNALETWSSNPVLITYNSTYDFTNAQSKAYGNNLYNLGDGNYAVYCGDISDALTAALGIQDGIVEAQDYGDMENAVYITLMGYVIEDITGDGIVESSDYGLMGDNVYFTRVLIRP